MVDFLGGKEEMKIQQKVNSVIFLLDVSNSMNAQDVQPSRLEQAKNILINTIQNLGDDKVGNRSFAGDAQSIMPLTTDYSAAENVYWSDRNHYDWETRDRFSKSNRSSHRKI